MPKSGKTSKQIVCAIPVGSRGNKIDEVNLCSVKENKVTLNRFKMILFILEIYN